MAITMDTTSTLFEAREPFDRKWTERTSFDLLEHQADLLLGRSMNACVSNGLFPRQQVIVLRREAFERASFQCIVLGILDPAFDLPLVLRCVRLGGKDDGSIVLGERLEFGATKK